MALSVTPFCLPRGVTQRALSGQDLEFFRPSCSAKSWCCEVNPHLDGQYPARSVALTFSGLNSGRSGLPEFSKLLGSGNCSASVAISLSNSTNHPISVDIAGATASHGSKAQSQPNGVRAVCATAHSSPSTPASCSQWAGGYQY